jgi:hypothetical protein
MLFVLLAVFIIGLFATINNYERAIVPDSPVVRNFIGPLIRSAPVIRPQMAVEVAVEEAVPVPEEVAILELADSDFPAIYSLVLPEVLELSQEIDDLTSTSTLLLIANIDSLANDGSTYILPEKSQFAISEELQELDYDVIWVQTLEDALIILEEQETDALVIDFSPFTIGVDSTVSSKISIFQQVDNIFEYKFTLSSNQGEWIINESELSN